MRPALDAEAYLRAFLNSPDGMVVTRLSDGLILETNAAFERLTGYGRDELLGRTTFEVDIWADPEQRAAILRQMREHAPREHAQLEIRPRAGEPRVVLISWDPIEIEGEDCALGLLRDVTDQVRLEQRIREAEERFRILVENVPAITYVNEASGERSGRLVYVSPQIRDILGWTAEDWLSTSSFWGDHVHPDDRDRMIAAEERIWRDLGPYEFEYRMVAADGRTVWLYDRGAVVRDEAGEPLLLSGVMLDVTAQKSAEERLRQAELRYRTLIEQLPAVTYLEEPDPEGLFGQGTAYMSPQFEELTGHSAERFVEDPDYWLEIFHPEDRERVAATYERTVASREPYGIEYRIIGTDGSVRWFHEDARPLRGPDGTIAGWQGVMFDITAQKEAEAALRAAEERYRTLIEQLPAITYVDDATSEEIVPLYVSPQIESILGYSVEAWMRGRGFWAQHVHTEDRARAVAADRRAKESREPFDMEYRMIAADGRVVWFHDRFRVEVHSDGGSRLVRGVLIDVTEQRQAEERLSEAEARYREVVENAVEGIFRTDLEGRFLLVNPALARMAGFGTPEEMMLLANAADLYGDPGRRDVFLAEMRRRGRVEGFEIRGRRRDGTEMWVSLSAHAIVDDRGAPVGFGGNLVDVTERRRAELERRQLLSRLVQAQEEERARIAEDIHDDSLQKMTAVSLRLHSLARQSEGTGLEAPFHQLESTVGVAIEHMRRLMFDLRPPALDREGLVSALQTALQEVAIDGGFEWHLEDRLASEPGAETRIVVYRVAREALVNVGKHAEARTVVVRLETVDGGVRVRIQDDGQGLEVEEALQPRPGHLGLSAMRERVELAGGRWNLQSSTGAGATLEFWVPEAG